MNRHLLALKEFRLAQAQEMGSALHTLFNGARDRWNGLSVKQKQAIAAVGAIALALGAYQTLSIKTETLETNAELEKALRLDAFINQNCVFENDRYEWKICTNSDDKTFRLRQIYDGSRMTIVFEDAAQASRFGVESRTSFSYQDMNTYDDKKRRAQPHLQEEERGFFSKLAPQ